MRLLEEIPPQPGGLGIRPLLSSSPQLHHFSEDIYIFPQEPRTMEPTLSLHLSAPPSCSQSSISPALMCFPWIWNQRKRSVAFSSTLCSEDAAGGELPGRLRQKKIFYFFLDLAFTGILLYFPGYTTLTSDFPNPEGFIPRIHLAKSREENARRGESGPNHSSISVKHTSQIS